MDTEDADIDENAMVDFLVLSGADPAEAKDKVHSMMGKEKITFMEVCGKGAIVEEANNSRRNLGIRGVGALDIRTSKPDGSAWDFMKRSDRRMARKLIALRIPND